MRVVKVRGIEKRGLGLAIRRARQQSVFSVDSICRQVGISRTAWYDLEKECVDAIDYDLLRAIEKLLGKDFGVPDPEKTGKSA